MNKSTFKPLLTLGLLFFSFSVFAQSTTTEESASYAERVGSQIEISPEQVITINEAYASVLDGLSPEKVANFETKMGEKLKAILDSEQYKALQELTADREKTNKLTLDKVRQNRIEALPANREATEE